MDKLYRKSGATFSTSGREWLPFRMNPALGRKNGRLRRLIKSGKFKPTLTKAEQRREADAAMLGRGPQSK
jgi:hypothetical protein